MVRIVHSVRRLGAMAVQRYDLIRSKFSHTVAPQDKREALEQRKKASPRRGTERRRERSRFLQSYPYEQRRTYSTHKLHQKTKILHCQRSDGSGVVVRCRKVIRSKFPPSYQIKILAKASSNEKTPTDADAGTHSVVQCLQLLSLAPRLFSLRKG